MATHEQIEAMANMASRRPQQPDATSRHRDLDDVDDIVQTSVNHVGVCHDAAKEQPMPYAGRDAGEVAVEEREMMVHLTNWNTTGRMHRTETYRVPIPDDLPPVPYTTPANAASPKPVIYVEPMRNNEETSVSVHANENIPVDIPGGAVADPLSRLLLVEQFREEILQEMMHGELSRNGVVLHQICAHEHHRTQLDEAVLNDGRANGRPYLVVEHITRHDRHPATGSCIYSTIPSESMAALLVVLLKRWRAVIRVFRTLSGNTGVRQNRVNTYVDNFGTNDSYRTIVWHWLDDERWLNLWRSRRG
ncbi:hypothetical protein QFC21_003495 [Naganishia friedmannii]|uniref:Uncharacterized protein n=1 Tax=Naganishia friedmannii TaxID=89922 RepID=A0ACC2VRL0_9TREE|nr:hypothetical protein QFC21_003495 [Naganishia friedmannii]